MRSQANKDEEGQIQLKDLLDHARHRCAVLEVELGHAQQGLADADERLDRFGAHLAAVRHEAQRLQLRVNDLTQSGEAASAQTGQLSAVIAQQEASIAQMTALLEQRDRELRLALERGGASRSDSGSPVVQAPRVDAIPNAAIQRRLRNAEEDAALQRALVDLLLEILQVIASKGKWWNAILPGAWVRRKKAARLRRKGLFDEGLYKKRYPDVGLAGMDPLHHYVSHGLQEGRSRT